MSFSSVSHTSHFPLYTFSFLPLFLVCSCRVWRCTGSRDQPRIREGPHFRDCRRGLWFSALHAIRAQARGQRNESFFLRPVKCASALAAASAAAQTLVSSSVQSLSSDTHLDCIALRLIFLCLHLSGLLISRIYSGLPAVLARWFLSASLAALYYGTLAQLSLQHRLSFQLHHQLSSQPTVLLRLERCRPSRLPHQLLGQSNTCDSAQSTNHPRTGSLPPTLCST